MRFFVLLALLYLASSVPAQAQNETEVPADPTVFVTVSAGGVDRNLVRERVETILSERGFTVVDRQRDATFRCEVRVASRSRTERRPSFSGSGRGFSASTQSRARVTDVRVAIRLLQEGRLIYTDLAEREHRAGGTDVRISTRPVRMNFPSDLYSDRDLLFQDVWGEIVARFPRLVPNP